MARLIEMPKLSPTMEEGQIATWHAKEGDAVDVDDLLAEVETDKATMEFRSFDRGVLLKILADAGAVVRLGDPVAIIGEAGENIDGLLASIASGGAAPDAAAPVSVPAAPVPAEAVTAAAPVPAEAATAAAPVASSIGAGGRIKASPYVRKLARERNLDLTRVAGSGDNGRIIARDLDGLPDGASGTRSRVAHVSAVDVAEAEVRPLSMMRKTIARRLTESKQTVPHFYLTIDVDAGPLVRLRKELNAHLADDPDPIKVSYNDLIIKAVATAIGRAPDVNAEFRPDAIVVHKRIDISVAVAVNDGLVTPVVRNANTLSVAAIHRTVRDLATRARNKKLRPEEMMNGTISISNLGMYGIDAFAAVINPPEGAILAVGGIRKEPVVSGDQVVVGHRMALTLSCDHRVVDGAVGATFLRELRKVLSKPIAVLAG